MEIITITNQKGRSRQDNNYTMFRHRTSTKAKKSTTNRQRPTMQLNIHF